MAEVTIYATNTLGGGSGASASSYADLYDATSGTGTDTSATYTIEVGVWEGSYWTGQLFLAFDTDTTNIPAGATINSVTLAVSRLAWGGSGSAGDFEAHIDDWSGGGFTSADYLSHAELTSLHSAGFVAASPNFSNTGDVMTITFTSESGFPDALNTDGYTYIAITPKNCRDETEAQQKFQLNTQYSATESLRPRLIVDYTEAASGRVLFPDFFGGLNCDMTGGI